MSTDDAALEEQADLLAEEALKELGGTPLDEADEYAAQCDYAGCYPWLKEILHVHPHDHSILSGDPAVEEMDFYG